MKGKKTDDLINIKQCMEDIGLVYPILVAKKEVCKLSEIYRGLNLAEADSCLVESYHQIVENRIKETPNFKRRPECPKCYECPLGKPYLEDRVIEELGDKDEDVSPDTP